MDGNRKDDDFEGEKIFIPRAASQRLDDLIHDKDNDLDQSYTTKTTSQTLKDFHSDMKLIVDYKNDPLWITPDGHIFLESFSSAYKQTHDFLIIIAEPICRLEYIHENILSAYSLYAAVSISLETNDIIETLQRLTSTTIPNGVIKFIKSDTLSYVKIEECRLITPENNIDINTITEKFRHLISETVLTKENTTITTNEQISDDIQHLYEKIDRDEDLEDLKIVSFEVIPDKIELLQKRCQELEYPLLDKYDFHHDTILKNLNIELRSNAILRSYQEKSLRNMFGNRCAQSDLIVLPCSAEKSLVDVTATCTISKSCLVLYNSNVSVRQ
ncbi:unnamed protein product [Rotaria sordida]|uniref:Helicase XPB/Ssl2 N-terminal domain-containing protein n=1 Tax=Rotaria sordida TaxID=392033 RepID=A0A819FHW1_9BILA|nr:unnamed protein product [Rotaria sordida]CAF3869077.1 unnamed protein product [Rotaria sordida]